jgi:hypothetical protein
MKATESSLGRPGRVLTITLGLLVASAALEACGDDPAQQAAGSAGGEAGESSGGAPGSGASSAQGGSGALPQAGVGSGMAGESMALGGDGAGGAPEAGMSLDEFCQLRERASEWLRECRTFGDAIGWWGTQNIVELCSSGREAIEAGRLVYDPLQAAECYALSVGGCDNIEAFAFGQLGGQAAFLMSNVCQGVVKGAVALGDDCHAGSTRYGDECADGFCSHDACPGTCTAFSAIDEGCDGISSECDPATSFCNASNVCEAYAEADAECSGSVPCAAGYRCHDGIDGPGQCVPIIEVGRACSASLDQCVSGSICYQGECATEVPLGADCNSPSICPAGAYCNLTCQKVIAVDDDCPNGYGCADGATCVEGKCRLYGAASEACPCQAGLWCDGTNTCRERGAEGAVCSPSLLNSCQVPLFCEPASGKCRVPGAKDAPCNYQFPLDSCESGLHCVCSSDCTTPATATASCQPQLENDSDCAQASECLSGVCTDQKCADSSACP